MGHSPETPLRHPCRPECTLQRPRASQRCTPQQQGTSRARTRQLSTCPWEVQEHALAARTARPHVGHRSPLQHAGARDTSPGERPAARRRRQSTTSGARSAAAPQPERGRQEVDPRTAAEGASRVRRRTGAGAIFRAERYSVAWRRTAQELPWCARADHSWRGAWRAFLCKDWPLFKDHLFKDLRRSLVKTGCERAI